MPEPITKDEIESYLQTHLISLLRTNAGGKSVPKIWLIRDDFGAITRTFDEPNEADKIGGTSAPFNALQADKIFRPKEQEVIEFLQSFRLSVPEAQRILDSIGMEP